MRRITLLVIVFCFTCITFGQTIKVQTGRSFSSLDWRVYNQSTSHYNETLMGYSFFIGLDYLDKKYFNLSSNLGFISKGGKQTVVLMSLLAPSLEVTYDARLDYLSANTLIDLKYPIFDKMTPYISVGPRIDYLIDYSNQYHIQTVKDDLNSLNYGFILGSGLKYDWSRFQIDIHAHYYLNFNKIADRPAEMSDHGTISDKTFTINLSLGYRL